MPAKASTRTKRARSNTKRRPDGIALLKKDHRTVDALFKKYEQLGERAVKSKENLVERIIRELSIHAAIEEQVLYPTVQQEVSRGKPMADHAIDEHQEVKEILAALLKMNPGDDRMDERMTSLIAAVREHVKEEESDLFPKLRASVEPTVLKRMGELMETAKKTAPTRPHPLAPARPPANLVVGMAAGVVDRVRDTARGARKSSGR